MKKSEIKSKAHRLSAIQNSKLKTALVLSGGGSRGAYQCGVWQALIELGVKIDMVFGVSVGAINGAMVAQQDYITAANLWRELETDQIFEVESTGQLSDYAMEFFKNGGASSAGLQKMVKEHIDEEAIRKSPVDFGLVTVEIPSMKPHYLWKDDIPKGKIGDYIIASASPFPAVQKYTIDGKDFVDGGFESNMPVSKAFERGATKVIAVDLKSVGVFDAEKELARKEDIILIEPKSELGAFLKFNSANSKRIMRLGYLDAMKIFEVYDGDFYSFSKGSFASQDMKDAETTAQIFNLDPLILYMHSSFLSELLDATSQVAADVEESIDDLENFNITARSAVDMLHHVNSKTATLLIAHDIKTKGKDSIFNMHKTPVIMKSEIQAAKFLLKFGLI